MRNPKAYEVQARVRLRVLATDEDEATGVVSTDVAERLTALLDELHAENPRLAGFCVHADELVDEA
jgi:hypothetical protein